MTKTLLALAGAALCATITLFTVTAVAKDKKEPAHWSWETKEGGVKLEWDLTINPDGHWKKVFKVDGWPCPHTDPKDSGNWCVGALAMGVKATDGKVVTFGSEGHFSTKPWEYKNEGTNEELAKHFDAFAKGHFDHTYHIEGHTAGWGGSFLNDVLGDLGKVLGVVGPVLAAL